MLWGVGCADQIKTAQFFLVLWDSEGASVSLLPQPLEGPEDISSAEMACCASRHTGLRGRQAWV